MAYRIEFTGAAKKAFDKSPSADKRRLADAINRLEHDPRHPGTIKLSGEEALYRTRAGDYRVIYRIEDDRLLVLVVKIGHRREVYR